MSNATVIVTGGADSGKEFVVKAGTRAVIGRSRECEIWLNDPAVSRQHVALEQEPTGRWVLTDLGSRSGMIVNGQARTGALRLESTTTLTIGDTDIRIVCAAVPDADKPTRIADDLLDLLRAERVAGRSSPGPTVPPKLRPSGAVLRDLRENDAPPPQLPSVPAAVPVEAIATRDATLVPPSVTGSVTGRQRRGAGITIIAAVLSLCAGAALAAGVFYWKRGYLPGLTPAKPAARAVDAPVLAVTPDAPPPRVDAVTFDSKLPPAVVVDARGVSADAAAEPRPATSVPFDARPVGITSDAKPSVETTTDRQRRPEESQATAEPARDSDREPSAARNDAEGDAGRAALALYKKGQCQLAAEKLDAAAADLPKSKAQPLRIRADAYREVCDALDLASAEGTTRPIVVLQALREAQTADREVGGALAGRLRTKVAEVAPAAGVAYVAKNDYVGAYKAAVTARAAGSRDSLRLANITLACQQEADRLLATASTLANSDEDAAAKLYERVLSIVDGKTPQAQKAKAGLAQ